MTCTIYSLEQKELWREALYRLPFSQQDVYMLPEYYALYQDDRDSVAYCFVFEHKGDIALYPFLKGRINALHYLDLPQEYFDIQGAYGYNGLCCSTESEDFTSRFYTAFQEYCQEQVVVAEFVRFNPILGNHIFSKGHMDIIPLSLNLVVDLTQSEEEIWSKGFEHSARKNINKAKKNGLIVTLDKSTKRLDRFVEIYEDTMTRKGSEGFYYFGVDYFRRIAEEMPSNSAFFYTESDGIPVSVELVLHSNYVAYSFLGGTLPDYLPMGANALLKHAIILEMKHRGISYFCLGGGYEANDGIFRYKKKFAKNGTTDFFIGKKIHHPDLYNVIVRQWENRFPQYVKKYGNRILKYRYAILEK